MYKVYDSLGNLMRKFSTYQAAVTRKVQAKKEITTKYLDTSYEFFGDDSDGTYPEYDGKESDDSYVTALKFKYNSFK